MTDAQFLELMARLDDFQMMAMIAFSFVLFGIGAFWGGQR